MANTDKDFNTLEEEEPVSIKFEPVHLNGEDYQYNNQHEFEYQPNDVETDANPLLAKSLLKRPPNFMVKEEISSIPPKWSQGVNN